MLKRMVDVTTAFIALCMLSPVMLVIALCVKISSPGPVLFQQRRVGQFGRVFNILKYRTMRVATTGSEMQITVGADPRITRIGHVLRQTKLDELPQLVNVLRGDMSIVGPRPEVERYVMLYPEHDRRIVQTVRPGITDRASIVYRNEAELLAQQADPHEYYKVAILPRKLAMSVDYARHHSFMIDLRIIVDTLVAVLAPKAIGRGPDA